MRLYNNLYPILNRLCYHHTYLYLRCRMKMCFRILYNNKIPLLCLQQCNYNRKYKCHSKTNLQCGKIFPHTSFKLIFQFELRITDTVGYGFHWQCHYLRHPCIYIFSQLVGSLGKFAVLHARQPYFLVGIGSIVQICRS